MKLVVIFALFALAIGKKKENSGKSMQKEKKEEGQGKIKMKEDQGKIKIEEVKPGMDIPLITPDDGEGKVELKDPKKEKTLKITPSDDKLLIVPIGKFTELKHGVSGMVSGEGKEEIKVLNIEDFNYSGKAPDAYFVVGTAGTGPQDLIDAGDEGSMKILCPTGKVFNYSDPTPAPILTKAVNETYSLNLPDNTKISDIKWIAVWCIKFKVLFGKLDFPKSIVPEEVPYGESKSTKEAGTETGLESETGSTTTLEPTTTTLEPTTSTLEPPGFKKVGNVYHFSLPLGAVAEIKAVAAEENNEEDPHGENAVDKGEGKKPEIMTLEDHRTVDVKPDHRTVVVKPEEEEEEESANASSIRLIPGKGKKGEGEGKMPKEDETGTDYVLP